MEKSIFVHGKEMACIGWKLVFRASLGSGCVIALHYQNHEKHGLGGLDQNDSGIGHASPRRNRSVSSVPLASLHSSMKRGIRSSFGTNWHYLLVLFGKTRFPSTTISCCYGHVIPHSPSRSFRGYELHHLELQARSADLYA